MKELLTRKSIILSLGFGEEKFPLLISYVERLWAANLELNLFSRQMQSQALVDNHVVDCVLALQHLPLEAKVIADLGSGGGLPGVIFAIARPHVKFVLYEKSPLKRGFLSSCRELAPNFEIRAEITEKIEGVDCVTARAFKPLDVILEMTRGYFLSGGKYALLKGRKEKIDEEIELSIKKFKNVKCQLIALKSPLLEVERHVVKIN